MSETNTARPEINLRAPRDDDYDRIIRQLDAWWGGRRMSAMLPRLFFTYFRGTTVVADAGCDPVGFITGFVVPDLAQDSYIHFVGVHPEYRRLGIARSLYSRFFSIAKARGALRVHCVTSPSNLLSLSFHHGMGFRAELGPAIQGGVPFHPDYDGPGEDRVLLTADL